jgi:hypothetical protein
MLSLDLHNDQRFIRMLTLFHDCLMFIKTIEISSHCNFCDWVIKTNTCGVVGGHHSRHSSWETWVQSLLHVYSMSQCLKIIEEKVLPLH